MLGHGVMSGAARRTAKIDNPINTSAHIVGNVQRTVGSHRQARRAVHGLRRGFHRSGKTIWQNTSHWPDACSPESG